MKYLITFLFIISFSSCGSGDPGAQGIQGLQGIPGPTGSPGPEGPTGVSCTVTKQNKKCYLKCSDGTWAYVGGTCG